MLSFELDGRQHPVPDVFAFRVVEHLYLVDYVLTSFIASTVEPATYSLPLQKIAEALAHCMVMAAAASAHRVNQIVVLDAQASEEPRQVAAGMALHCSRGCITDLVTNATMWEAGNEPTKDAA